MRQSIKSWMIFKYLFENVLYQRVIKLQSIIDSNKINKVIWWFHKNKIQNTNEGPKIS